MDENEDEDEDDDNDDDDEAHTRLRQNQLLRVERNLDWCGASVWSNLIVVCGDSKISFNIIIFITIITIDDAP